MVCLNYFVTGGAGFIGRETVRQLLLRNCRVTVYDDFSFGRKENLEEFKGNKLLRVIIGKVEDSDNVSEEIMKVRPDIIIHLAAIHFIPFCIKNPTETIKINVDGTYSVLNAAVRFGVKRVLLASSGAIYASEAHCLSERSDLPHPVDVYGCSKLLSENIGEYFAHISPLEVISMRFFNTYGPFETNKHLIPEIIEQIKKGDNIYLGNITSKRDYIYTEDIARAIVMLSESDKLKKYEIVNIGTGVEYSAKEIVEKFSLLLKRELTIKTDEGRMRKSDKNNQIADITLLNQKTGWMPQYDLCEGLKKLLCHEQLI